MKSQMEMRNVLLETTGKVIFITNCWGTWLNFVKSCCFMEGRTCEWRRQWHPTPVLLPGKSHGWRSLVGCSPWVAKSQTWLSNFTFTFHFHALEMEMATHSSVLAWRIPGTGELGGPPSMVSHRVGHDWSNLAAAELVSSEIGYLAEAISKQSVPSKGWLLLNTYSKMWEKKWLKEVTVSQRGSRNFKLRKFLFHHFAKKM